MKTNEFWARVADRFLNQDERWGQAVFNTLCMEAAINTDLIHGTLDDPFYRLKTRSSAKAWFDKFVEVDADFNITGIKE
jgi:hypothetical protein